MEYKITRATLDDAEEMIEIENICFKYPWPAFAFMAELMFDDSLFYALRSVVCDGSCSRRMQRSSHLPRA